MMSARPIPKGLRWFFFVLGVCSLVASGIYVGTATRDPNTGGRLLRAMMFLLNGLFWVLMYGENRDHGSERARATDRSGVCGLQGEEGEADGP